MARSASSRFYTILMILAASVIIAGKLLAQRPDCNLARPAFDNPFSDSHGWVMRRYQWHAFYAIGAFAIGEGIHRVSGMGRVKSAIVTGVITSLAWHVRGVIRRSYRFDWRDWIFDGFIHTAPMIMFDKSPRLAAPILAGGYFALACYGSP